MASASQWVWTKDSCIAAGEESPAASASGDTSETNLKFALRYEPNGTFARRAWFFREWLTGVHLDLPDAGAGAGAGAVGYTPALPPDKYIVVLMLSRISQTSADEVHPIVRLEREPVGRSPMGWRCRPIRLCFRASGQASPSFHSGTLYSDGNSVPLWNATPWWHHRSRH